MHHFPIKTKNADMYLQKQTESKFTPIKKRFPSKLDNRTYNTLGETENPTSVARLKKKFHSN